MRSGPRPFRVVAFEPFDAGSHRAVRESISRRSRHRWHWLTRPARGWKWRMRLAAVELVEEARRSGVFDEPADVIVATSLLGAADLRALLPRGHRETPLVVYMHENQVAYPWSDHPKVDRRRDVHFAMTNLTSVLAADRAIFNSAYNLQSFLTGMEGIVRRASAVQMGDWRRCAEERSCVIWPPVEPPPDEVQALVREKLGRPLPAGECPAGGALHNATRVVWPHRWEHDKGPEELLAVGLAESDRLDLRWTLLGYQYPGRPAALVDFERTLAGRIDHLGYEPDRRRYWERLAGCDWVLSTARQEFFGIAVVEAILAGCMPWLPARLSYPELVPPEFRGMSPRRPPRDRAAAHRALVEWLRPALAAESVEAIDGALDEVVSGHSCPSGPKSGSCPVGEPPGAAGGGEGRTNAADESGRCARARP